MLHASRTVQFDTSILGKLSRYALIFYAVGGSGVLFYSLYALTLAPILSYILALFACEVVNKVIAFLFQLDENISGIYKWLARFSFSILSLIALLMLLTFYYSTEYRGGEPLFRGGDALFYYNQALRFAGIQAAEYSSNFFPGYFTTLGSWLYLVHKLSFSSIDYYSPRVCNVLAASQIVPMTFLLCRSLNFTIRRSRAIALMTLSWGIFIVYSCVLVRDIIIYFLTLLICVCLTYANKDFKFSGQFLLKALILVSLYFLWQFRPLSMLLSAAGIFLYAFFNSRKSLVLRWIYISICVVLVIVYGASHISYITSLGERYHEITALESSGGSSLSYRYIYGSSNPVSLIFRYLYTLYTPIPPIVFTYKQDLSTILILVGAIEWYFLAPASIIAFIKALKTKEHLWLHCFSQSMIVYGIFGVVDLRHKLQVFPLLFVLSLNEMYTWDKGTLHKYCKSICILLAFCFLSYFWLKL